MDIRRLEVFSKLMETRSFSKTGLELNLTQPTISGHIKTLEEELGLTLFDRHKRKVVPTHAAQVLWDFARRMLDLRAEAGAALDRLKGYVGGPLALGGSTIPATYILPVVMGPFHKRFPETHLRLIMGDTRNIVDRVAKGEIELGVVGAADTRDDVVFEPLIDDEMVLALPPDGEPADKKTDGPLVTLDDLRRMPFIIREDGSGTRTVMLDALGRAGLAEKDLRIVARIEGTEPVRQAVKAGLGASILSRVAVAEEVRDGRIRVKRVQNLDLGRRFYLVTHARRPGSLAQSAFTDHLRAARAPLSTLLEA